MPVFRSEVRVSALSRPLVIAILLACAPAAIPQRAPEVVPQTGVGASSQWEPDIRRFEAADRINRVRPGTPIVFVGSSSIRMWQTLEADFPGLPVLNRGFGGSELSDVVRFVDRIVVPHKPRVIVLYAGENDLAAGEAPAQVFKDFQSFVAVIRRKLPETRLVFVSLKPSLARLNIIDKFRETNRLIRDYVRGDDKIVYVDVFTPMLDASGQPRPELFLEDGLHMNARGYAIWRDLIAPVIR
jgi:lysophospholipase L1-like esterase